MRTIRLAIAAFFVLSSGLVGQVEGIAEFKGSTVTGRGETMPARGKFFVSKNAFRMEWQVDLQTGQAPGSGKKAPTQYATTMIQKLSEPDVITLLNQEQKTYSIVNVKKSREQATDGETYTVKKAGRDTVGGLSCDKALLTSSAGTETEVCVTRELVPSNAWLAAMNRRNPNAGLGKALHDNGLDGFPIRWIVRRKGTTEVASSMELVRFHREPVPASVFEIPPGYRQTASGAAAMSPEQRKAMKDALDKMTPEQRKRYEEMMKKQ